MLKHREYRSKIHWIDRELTSTQFNTDEELSAEERTDRPAISLTLMCNHITDNRTSKRQPWYSRKVISVDCMILFHLEVTTRANFDLPAKLATRVHV